MEFKLNLTGKISILMSLFLFSVAQLNSLAYAQDPPLPSPPPAVAQPAPPPVAIAVAVPNHHEEHAAPNDANRCGFSNTCFRQSAECATNTAVLGVLTGSFGFCIPCCAPATSTATVASVIVVGCGTGVCCFGAHSIFDSYAVPHAVPLQANGQVPDQYRLEFENNTGELPPSGTLVTVPTQAINVSRARNAQVSIGRLIEISEGVSTDRAN